jgi:hypothetical protein
LWKTAVLLPLVAVSGSECVEALLAAGFSVRSRSDDLACLVSGMRSVSVPTVAMLTPDELVAVLRQAGVAYTDFLDLLSEAPTDPDIRPWALAASSPPPR